LVEGVALLLAGGARGAREEVQIVVAEDARDRGVVRDGPAQHVERARAAVDEIADKPDGVAVRREVDQREQALEARHAALNVSDRIARHDRWYHAAPCPVRRTAARCSGRSAAPGRRTLERIRWRGSCSYVKPCVSLSPRCWFSPQVPAGWTSPTIRP